MPSSSASITVHIVNSARCCILVCVSPWGKSLVLVCSPSEVAGLIPAFSTCFVYVVPWVPGCEADNKQV